MNILIYISCAVSIGFIAGAWWASGHRVARRIDYMMLREIPVKISTKGVLVTTSDTDSIAQDTLQQVAEELGLQIDVQKVAQGVYEIRGEFDFSARIQFENCKIVKELYWN